MSRVVESNPQNIVEHYNRDGYAVIRGFLDPSETQAMLDEIERYIREDLEHLPADAVFYEDKSDPATLFRLDSFDTHSQWGKSLLKNERFVSLASELLGEPAVPYDAHLFGKAPRIGNETPPHQDGYYWKIDPQVAATIWLPLDIVDENNGCIRYVPGSHKEGMRPHGRGNTFGFSLGLLDYDDKDRANEVAVACEPGDLIVHHTLTAHRADPNRSDRRRWAIGLVYWGQSARVNEADAKAHAETMKVKWEESNRL